MFTLVQEPLKISGGGHLLEIHTLSDVSELNTVLATAVAHNAAILSTFFTAAGLGGGTGLLSMSQ